MKDETIMLGFPWCLEAHHSGSQFLWIRPYGRAGLGIMVWLNVIAIIILAKPALIVLKDYETQKKAGVVLVFDPKVLGIKNAFFWEHEYTGDKENVS